MRVNEYQWEETVVEALKAMLTGEEILSYQEIAVELSALFHYPFTKNMCIGKARRLGFGSRVKDKRGGAELARRTKVVSLARVREVSAPIEPLPEDFLMDPSDRVTFDQLQPGCCKFPFGDHPNLLFCGAPQQDESPYCAIHHDITHLNPLRPRHQWRKPSYALR